MPIMEVSCFIPGEENTFTIDINDIDMTQKAYRLKKLIMQEMEKMSRMFANVSWINLILYQVTINDDLEKRPRMEELERLYKEREESKVLDDGKPLRKYFGSSPPLGFEYYIIVQIPEGEYY